MSNACQCGHDRAAHQHYRAGSDCAICQPGACGRYRQDFAVSRWRTWFRAVTPGATTKKADRDRPAA